jgi:hypothetical protein
MAKSSVYQFFDSTKTLYVELMLREAVTMKQRFIDQPL